MLLLAVLAAAWLLLVLPNARRAKAIDPLPSAERFKGALGLVAPLSRYEARVANATREVATNPRERARRRRFEILVFLGSGTLFSSVAAVMGQSAAKPLVFAFFGLLLAYLALLVEVVRRQETRFS